MSVVGQLIKEVIPALSTMKGVLAHLEPLTETVSHLEKNWNKTSDELQASVTPLLSFNIEPKLSALESTVATMTQSARQFTSQMMSLTKNAEDNKRNTERQIDSLNGQVSVISAGQSSSFASGEQ